MTKDKSTHPHRALEDLSGTRFSLLTVLRRDVSKPRGRRWWECACDCGNHVSAPTAKLVSGHTKSCGCLRVSVGREKASTHGLRNSPEYGVWAAMRQRCRNENNPCFNIYGGRGIRIASRWEDFSAFYTDMGQRPSPRHTIERRDVNSGYSPENCYWTDDCARQAINQNLKSNNTSGKSGVYFRKDRNKWVASTFSGGKARRHGSFDSKEEAILCRISAELHLYGMQKPDKEVGHAIAD